MSLFREYIAAGWKLCLITPGNKGPTGAAATGWNLRENAITDPLKAYALPGAGLCHAWSGTCALDIDDMQRAEPFLREHGVDLQALLAASASVQISSGREGRAKLLYALDTPLRSLKLCPYQLEGKTYHALELRCATADGTTVQDVLPPTIHPATGRAYEWKYGNDLFGDWRSLPRLPASLYSLWMAHAAAPRTEAGPVAPVGAEFSELRELLEAQDPDASYEDWLRVGMALHHETGGALAGLALWDEWSARGTKYKGRHDLEPHWSSFRPNAQNPVTIGSLRRDAVAKATDFRIVEPSTQSAAPAAGDGPGVDMRPDAVMQRLVGDKVVYVRSIERYFNLEDRRIHQSDKDLRNRFKPITPEFDQETKHGTRKYKPDAIGWLQNSLVRLERDVHALGMHPGEGSTYVEGGMRYANTFAGLKRFEPIRPTPFEQEAFKFIWSRIPDPVYAAWLLQFYAFALKYPGRKIRAVPLLVSYTTGSGKSTIMAILPEILFGSVFPIGGPQLRSEFNGELAHTWWATLQEVYAGAEAAERRRVSEKVKTWITDDEIAIVPKGLTPYRIKNRLQFTASSNHLDALQLDDDDERRWGVCGIKEAQWSPQESMDVFGDSTIENARALLCKTNRENGRAGGVLTHLLQLVNLTGFNPDGRAPKTDAKRSMHLVGLGSWESRLVGMMIAGEPPFGRDLFNLRDLHVQLLGRGPTSEHKLAAVLKKPPFFCEVLPNHRKERIWAWRNVKLWRRATDGQRKDYLSTGVRPFPAWGWSDELPAALRLSSADSIGETPAGSSDCVEALI